MEMQSARAFIDAAAHAVPKRPVIINGLKSDLKKEYIEWGKSLGEVVR
jgi:hypothetical protein